VTLTTPTGVLAALNMYALLLRWVFDVEKLRDWDVSLDVGLRHVRGLHLCRMMRETMFLLTFVIGIGRICRQSFKWPQRDFSHRLSSATLGLDPQRKCPLAEFNVTVTKDNAIK
jgi:hypothetical protein